VIHFVRIMLDLNISLSDSLTRVRWRDRITHAVANYGEPVDPTPGSDRPRQLTGLRNGVRRVVAGVRGANAAAGLQIDHAHRINKPPLRCSGVFEVTLISAMVA
jgi:hypothetical protein